MRYSKELKSSNGNTIFCTFGKFAEILQTFPVEKTQKRIILVKKIMF